MTEEKACVRHNNINTDNMNRKIVVAVCTLLLAAAGLKAQEFKLVKTFPCPEANQGIAVDDHYFYGIGNQTIVKCNKEDGKCVKTWKETAPELIKHFDGGIIIDGLLYCSHSNYPDVPMASSIEVFDPKDLSHVKTISFGIEYGSCTWVVRGDGCWYACFAHYDRSGGGAGGEVLKDNSWSQILQFDDQWRKLQAWIVPREVLDICKPNSLSGGLFMDGKFWCTGHDAQELFILEFPPYGMRMKYAGSIKMPIKGQGVALDSDGFLWGIDRKTKSVIKAGR